MTITYDKLLELYFQNPEFGYYFLRLSSERLLQNVARLEAIIARNASRPEAAGGKSERRPSAPAEPRPVTGQGSEAAAQPAPRATADCAPPSG